MDRTMQIDLSRFRDTFFQESAEHLAEMENGLLRLEREPGDAELLNAIFRAAHSIKGASGTFGFEDVAHFTHGLESLLDRLRGGEIQVTHGLVDLLLRSEDMLRDLLTRAAAGTAAPEEMAALVTELHQASGTAGKSVPVPAANHPAEPAESKGTAYRVSFRPSTDLFQQGMDPLLILRDVAALGESVTTIDVGQLPPLSGLDPEQCYLAWTIRLVTSKTVEEIRDVFAFVEDNAEIRIEPEVPDSRPAAVAVTETKAAAAPAGTASLRVSTSKVDKLIDLVGELVIAQSMAKAIVEGFTPSRLNQLREAMAETERYTRELQERVMSVRMLPISQVFSRFPRLVRDVAAQLGKQVRIEMAGEETELDKGVVERMSDPLTHLVRNAIDHGIESPEERRRLGKPEEGLLRLEAYHQGGNVVVSVSDDGRGLDAERIRHKAVERGLIAESAVLTAEQAHNLIFEPGFSTAETVSDVSGRGVGMDVVKRSVQALNGSVAVRTQASGGTAVTIRLPLTLAILDGLLLKVGAETYVLPLVSIVESIRPLPEHVRGVAGRGEVVAVRGEALPLMRLHRLFAIPTEITDPCRGLTVIMESGGQRAALLVDELLGQQQVVVKSLEAHYRKVQGVLGATILGDGRPALILDAAGLAQAAHNEEAA
jgi:two-component system chemotaxis sensor kinase CheA